MSFRIHLLGRAEPKTRWYWVILVAVEALPVGNKPPTAVSVRISTGKRHDFGAAAPLSTKTSSQRRRAGGSAFMPKLVELVGSAWTLCRTAIPIHRLICCSALRTLTSLFLSDFTSASMTRRGCRASSWSRLAERCLGSLVISSPSVPPTFSLVDLNDSLLFSAVYRIFFQKVDIRPPAWVDHAQILLSGERGHCPQGQPCSSSVAKP